MVNNPLSNNEQTCSKCGSPLTPGIKFCESCGAKVEQPPVCVQCGASLLPNAKFCESCGKPVAAPTTQAPAAVQEPPVAKPTAAAPGKVEVKKPAPPPEAAITAKEKAAEKKIPEKPIEPARKTTEKTPASRTQTLAIVGVVGLVIVAALAYFVLLPMLAGPGATSGGNSIPLLGASPVPTSASSAAPAQTASVSFVPEPTQVPPAALLVNYEAARDPITGLVTVTFRGGTGQYGVSDVSIRLSRSDGQVQTQTFKPQQIGSTTTLQGTLMTDRIEVVANYYNGEKYRIIDQLFEYKKKNF
jgi:hypothetical protein